jgi:hypothetical protein
MDALESIYSKFILHERSLLDYFNDEYLTPAEEDAVATILHVMNQYKDLRVQTNKLQLALKDDNEDKIKNIIYELLKRINNRYVIHEIIRQLKNKHYPDYGTDVTARSGGPTIPAHQANSAQQGGTVY